MLPSLIEKRLLVATIRVLPTSSHNIAVKGKSGRGPALGHFSFFPYFLFLIFSIIPKIKWTKSEEKRNFWGR